MGTLFRFCKILTFSRTKIRGSEPEPLLSASGHQEVRELGETSGETSGRGLHSK